MSSKELSFTRRVNFSETVDLLLNSGHNSVHLTGEPGVGKTAIQDVLVAKTGYHKVYIDGPNTDVGQAGMPIPNHETRTLDFYPGQQLPSAHQRAVRHHDRRVDQDRRLCTQHPAPALARAPLG